MNTHTLCLNSLLLFMTLYPVSICQMIQVGLSSKHMHLSESVYMILMVIVYAVLVLGVLVIRPELYHMSLPDNSYWYVIGILSGPVIIVIEIVLGYFMLRIEGHKVSSMTTMKLGGSIASKFAIIGVGALEELVYRQVWFGILYTNFGITIRWVVLLSALFYAINHMTLGYKVFLQKFISGILFSLLYVYSGFAIVVPILAHVVQNAIVVGRGD